MESDGVTWLLAGVKLGLVASGLLVIGIALNRALGLAGPGAGSGWRWLVAGLSAVLVICAGARVLLGAVQLNGGWDGALSGDILTLVWSVHRDGCLAHGIGAGLGLIGAVVNRAALSALSAAPIAAGFAMTGHVAGLPAPGWLPVALGFHVALAGVWAAAPITLWPRAEEAALFARRLQRFSALALAAAPVVFASGVWLALSLAGGLAALGETAYGRLLIAKAGVVSGVVALGAVNKLVLIPAIARGEARAIGWLRVTLAVDGALFAAAMVLITLATTLTRP